MAKNYQAPLQTTPSIKTSKYDSTTNLILDKARGHWPSILESLGINASYLLNKHGPCPVCGGKDRFRFDNKGGHGTFICNQCGAGNGIKLVQLYHDWSFWEACNRVAELLGEKSRNYSRWPRHISSILNDMNLINKAPHATKNELEKRHKSLNIVWTKAKPVTVGDPVDCYLRRRGIALNVFPEVLRFHPQLPYYNDDGVLVDKFPAMLALVQNNNNQGVTLHRTYLGQGCKADVPKPKKLMSTIKPGASIGASIKLYEPKDGKIVLAEGIESALSVKVATDLPVWATISAGGLEKVILPPSIKNIIIAVDNDKSGRGQEAAFKLSQRLLMENRFVKRVMSPIVGQDFNDLLLEGSI